MEQIQRRLRHRSLSSMRRCEKAARAQAEVAKIPKRWRFFAEAVGSNFSGIMMGRDAVPELP